MHDVDAMNPFRSEWDEFQPETFENGYETSDEIFGETDGESPLDEEAAMDLAAELLSVNSEDELDQFLGKLFKKVSRSVGKFVRSPLARTLGGALKGIAKKALPLIGQAAGGALAAYGVPPQLGMGLGSGLGSAAGNMLGGEYGGMSPEDEEFDRAKRYVKLASGALKRAANFADHVDPKSAAKAALAAAAKRYAPQLLQWLGEAGPMAPGTGAVPGAGAGPGRPGQSGRWIRRGHKIVLLGV
jgi:uncharacterized protein (DUF697 family)